MTSSSKSESDFLAYVRRYTQEYEIEYEFSECDPHLEIFSAPLVPGKAICDQLVNHISTAFIETLREHYQYSRIDEYSDEELLYNAVSRPYHRVDEGDISKGWFSRLEINPKPGLKSFKKDTDSDVFQDVGDIQLGKKQYKEFLDKALSMLDEPCFLGLYDRPHEDNMNAIYCLGGKSTSTGDLVGFFIRATTT